MRYPQAIGAAVLVAILWAPPLFACICIPPAPSRALETAAVVFSGIAESATQCIDLTRGTRRPHLQWHFKVGQVWKGPRTPSLVLDDLLGSCGYSFVRGEHYVVFADSVGYRLCASECNRTRPVKRAQVERLALGLGAVVNDSLRLPALTAAEHAEAARELRELEREWQVQHRAEVQRLNERRAYEQSWVRYRAGQGLPETVTTASRRRTSR